MYYPSVLDAAAVVRTHSQGALLAKMDLQNAYRILLVHADDHPLLAISWGQATYLSTALPFGLCSALKVFLAFTYVCSGLGHAEEGCIQTASLPG